MLHGKHREQMRRRRHPLVSRSSTLLTAPIKSSLLSLFPQRTASTASGASGAPAVRLASSTSRCAKPPQSGTSQARPGTGMVGELQTQRETCRAASRADYHPAAVRAQHVARAGEVQDDLEEGEVRRHV